MSALQFSLMDVSIHHSQKYGFDQCDGIEDSTYQQFYDSYSKVLERRAHRWDPLLSKGQTPKKNAKVKRFVRKGIPPQYRSQLWMAFSGAKQLMEQHPGHYHQLLSKQPDQASREVIEADIPRTFPENIHFRQGTEASNSKLRGLRNVLMAFAVQNPEIGYCQGLNFITAILLMVTEDEEKTFWLLDALVTQILPRYYDQDMVAVQVDCRVLYHLIRKKLPAVFNTMENCGADICLIGTKCTKWFICLFIDVLPVETSMRVLDCLFYEGDKILFRVALTLLKTNTERILRCQHFPDFITCFTEIEKNKSAVFCHEFILSMFKIPGRLTRSGITKLRNQYETEVRASMNS